MRVATRLIQAMVTVAAVLLAESAALAQAIVPTNSAPNPYRAIENWARLPEGRTWGSTNSVDIDRDGVSVWVAERCGSFAPPSMMKPGLPFACLDSPLPPILKFDASGNLVKSFGVGTARCCSRVRTELDDLMTLAVLAQPIGDPDVALAVDMDAVRQHQRRRSVPKPDTCTAAKDARGLRGASRDASI